MVKTTGLEITNQIHVIQFTIKIEVLKISFMFSPLPPMIGTFHFREYFPSVRIRV